MPTKNPPLREKHKRFCQEYIKDHNGYQAAIRAGYSPRSATSTASEILTYPKIQAYLASLHAKAEKKAVMSAAEVLEELSLIGRTEVADFVEVKKGGVVAVRALNALPPGASRCIRKLRQKVTTKLDSDAQDGSRLQEVTTEFELWNKEGALDLLGRHHKLWDGKGGDADRPAVVNINFGRAKKPAKPGAA